MILHVQETVPLSFVFNVLAELKAEVRQILILVIVLS